MRRTLVALLFVSFSIVIVAACGGAVAPVDDKQSGSGGTSRSGSGGTSGSGSSTGSDQSSSGATSGGVICTAGNYVFCRCADRSEGTKLCRDGASFDACVCDPNPPTIPPTMPCSYPPSLNPPGCPAMYSHSYQGQPCPQDNLDCSYFGAGDPLPGGCAATAMLFCRVAPGGATYWLTAQ